ncbi:unnamed protein product, partial [Ectocarpus fasciculatus]
RLPPKLHHGGKEDDARHDRQKCRGHPRASKRRQRGTRSLPLRDQENRRVSSQKAPEGRNESRGGHPQGSGTPKHRKGL